MVLVSHVAEDTNMASIGDFVGKDEDFVDLVAEWLTQQGLQKLVDVFKGKYSL